MQLVANTTVMPVGAPTDTTSINVSTSTSFKGRLEGNPANGMVRVTDAHPAGVYTVTVTAFNSGGATTKTFALTVTTPQTTCNPVTFTALENFDVGFAPVSVAVGDFDGDGRQDLVTTNASSDNVSVLLGNGAGSFGAATNFSAGFTPVPIAVGDFNGDGKEDLAVGNNNSNNLSVLLGNGTGGFSAPFDFAVGTTPTSVAVGDFDGDGKQDLVVANQGSNNVSVLVRNCPPGSISGTISYCSLPVRPVPNVTLTLAGSVSGSTLSDGSGNYQFSSLASGGSYIVTPTKAALAPGSTGINTVDAIATQRHFLNIGTPLSGCTLTAADVNIDTSINTVDVIALQRFFLGLSTGIAQTGNYKFTPVSRSYTPLTSNQTGQNYDTVVYGDVASSFVHLPEGQSQDTAGDGTGVSALSGLNTSAGEIPATVATLSLPNVAVDAFVTHFIVQVTTTAIDAKSKLVGFQGDFTFDESVVNFQSEPVQKAGITGGNWNVSGNVLDGPGPIRTLRISAYSLDFTPLSGSGTLFELRLTRVSQAAQGTPLIWAAPPNHFIFIDADLSTQRPGNAAPGSVTQSGRVQDTSP